MSNMQYFDAGEQRIRIRKDLHIPMRDGIKLVADAYEADIDKPRPALVALSPYGKELQALALTTPPQRRPSPLWDGCIEAGDIAKIVSEDYVHVIGDLRGSGGSEGEHIGNYNAGGVSLGEDAYDFIEWVAAQPWCDGNVGMVGISYFGSMQILAAAERPPHLKAIFVSGGHYDFYETTYHGGIMWFMPRAAREGRGGDSGWAFTDGVKSRMIEEYSPTELKDKVAKRLADPDIQAWPNLVHTLTYPKNHEAWFDIVMNQFDGPWYEERNPNELASNIDIPVWLQLDQGRGWTLDSTIEVFDRVKGPKKLTIGAYPPMQSRPFIEEHDKMFAWYDYWLKGIDNGIMDEPPVDIFVEGSREIITAEQWPPKDINYTPLYLRPRQKLSTEKEAMGTKYAAPDGFYQAPLTVTDDVNIVSWSTPAFEDTQEMIGTGAAHIFASIDQEDTNFILRIWDVAPTGKRQLLTTGYLKASHRELDEARTTEGNPYHPHTRAIPVEPGRVEEYVIRLYPFAASIQPGHKVVAELSNAEPLVDDHNSLLPPDAFHLPVGKPVTHKIYRDATYPSRLVLPFTK
ncbi:X-Pro dipeptidyl-peptidase domain-containing protein [Corynebacterium glutamicum MT]|uniref:X-Pro dipeptidyl-peptidase n=1 Tax=Corynebacterium glutamicum TaxID=1718 RepID=A0AB36IBK7_CORGT|nr:CocE/NonD family hydrolase [Corynebacterium glutamicum]AGN18815.1 X-Pro dipeptidyl-peptidase domain-containing protein [Corynebacterium glutamicum SCgG1]AGN21838.1 X-Pro dipeptidyl-peptidase domain-containing protein [Corynebacterium glutamicum SCgG2]EGV39205.1 X-Pro dipeptidyl-peptidase domain-containing protein [Corynebacterium glutamicum S9114]EOA65052.1 X-Pro dipeptidyl-peptidase domain-containing protein [Corynebacterium glutamicum MT]EPP41167.1 X-Pro dipeptidyl-peptidase domain-contai